MPASVQEESCAYVVSLACGIPVDTGITVAESATGRKTRLSVRPEHLVVFTGDNSLFEGRSLSLRRWAE